MSDIHDEIRIDCRPQPRSRPSSPRPAPAPAGRCAPVALGQKPPPPTDHWDQCDARPIEFGSLDELKAQLVERLEEALTRAREEWEPTRWDLQSQSWPYTKIGFLLLRCISLAEAITDKVNKEHLPSINSRPTDQSSSDWKKPRQ